ncbi:MAG: MCE family protein [Actinophytocola sp.]|nr:MCE family protein [Actinophytocola sp.]
MRIPHALIPAIRITVVLVFAALCTAIFSFLWVNAGGKIPLVSRAGYQVDVMLPDVDNLVFQSDIRMAGVPIGKVEDVKTGGGDKARVTLELDEQVAPLHQGATVTVRNKTMIEETYLEVADGRGGELPSGTLLAEDAGKPSVQLDDVLTSLDKPTREALRQTIHSSAAATRGGKDDISRSLQGLGELGREGGDALTALAAQSKDLRQVANNTTALLQALDTRQGRVTELVRDSNALTKTMSANRKDLEQLMRELPPLLDTTTTASKDLRRFAGALAPVTADLKRAAPDLSAALRELPATTEDLRKLLPSLNRALDRAPATLDRVPAFADSTRPLLSTLEVELADVNPMLAYLRPYGRDLAAFFTNFSSYLGGSDANGHIGRVMPVMNEKSVNSPLDTQRGPLRKYNPYPKPGGATDPENFHGEYPRVEEEPPR